MRKLWEEEQATDKQMKFIRDLIEKYGCPMFLGKSKAEACEYIKSNIDKTKGTNKKEAPIKNSLENLAKLMIENPTLPVIGLVDANVRSPGEEFNGSVAKVTSEAALIDEYAFVDGEGVVFKSNSAMYSESKLRWAEWKKAIFVRVVKLSNAK